MASRDQVIKMLLPKADISEFNFDMLTGPRVLDLLSPYEVNLLDDISKDPRLITKLEKRIEYNDQILGQRGFMRITQGTNRAVYKFLEDQKFVFKVAISVKGREDSPREIVNQRKLKPFVTKCFDVSPTGIIGSFERVTDIVSKNQFYQIAGSVFDLLNKIVERGYVMSDIGTKFFRNYGIRDGFGPVLLDYPLLFQIDGEKLFCSKPTYPFGAPCGGQIDYDVGFNHFYCEKCGIQYSGSQLEKKIKTGDIEVIGARGGRRMKIKIMQGDKCIKEINNDVRSSDTYIRNHKREPKPVEKKPQQPQQPNQLEIERVDGEVVSIGIGNTNEQVTQTTSSLFNAINSYQNRKRSQAEVIVETPKEEEESSVEDADESTKDESVEEENVDESTEDESVEEENVDESTEESVEEENEVETDDKNEAENVSDTDQEDAAFTEDEDPVETYFQYLENIDEFMKKLRELKFSDTSASQMYFSMVNECAKNLPKLFNAAITPAEVTKETINMVNAAESSETAPLSPEELKSKVEELNKKFANF